MNERQAPDGVAYLDLSRSNRLSYTRSVYPVETLCTTLVSTIITVHVWSGSGCLS